ncbi:MAG: AAA family ATPase [Colwellia sp.]|nr:AAA family ATPase [Colwellia sp.]
MSQFDYIKDIAKYALDNNQQELLRALNELIKYSKETKKTNFAIQLQSIIKDSLIQGKKNEMTVVGSPFHEMKQLHKDLGDFILERLTSDYRLPNLIVNSSTKEELKYFIEEHNRIDELRKIGLPVTNKILFHGPSGCGKTLAAYVLAGELAKPMMVVNLGAIVSSKLGETSKNLAKIFRAAAQEDCILFIDEFDSVGKIRDYDQDHGEMKRIVNTILQLFDYLPQSTVIIAATNQLDMIDGALKRRFDLSLKLETPNKKQLTELINKLTQGGKFVLDKPKMLTSILKEADGLSFFSVQKTLITAIKRSILESQENHVSKGYTISTRTWLRLLTREKSLIGL